MATLMSHFCRTKLDFFPWIFVIFPMWFVQTQTNRCRFIGKLVAWHHLLPVKATDTISAWATCNLTDVSSGRPAVMPQCSWSPCLCYQRKRWIKTPLKTLEEGEDVKIAPVGQQPPRGLAAGTWLRRCTSHFLTCLFANAGDVCLFNPQEGKV